MVGRAGIEPAANGLKVRCSTAELTAHLSHYFWTCPINSNSGECQGETDTIPIRERDCKKIVPRRNERNAF